MKLSLKNKQKLKRILLIVLAFLVLTTLAALLFRQPLFRYVTARQLQSIEAKTGYRITFSDARLLGFTQVGFDPSTVLTASGDTLFTLNTIEVEVSPLNFIRKKPFVESLVLKDAQLHLNKYLKKKPAAEAPKKVENEKEDLFSRIHRLQKEVFRYLPTTASISNFQVFYADSLGTVKLVLEELKTEKNDLHGKISVHENGSIQQWSISGNTSAGFNCEITSQDNNNISLLKERFKLGLSFSKLRLHLEQKENSEFVSVGGFFEDLKVHHRKLSADTIVFQLIGADMPVKTSGTGITIDTTATFALNKIHGTFGALVSFPKKDSVYMLKVKSLWTDATDFFASMPLGAFDDVRGLEASGLLQYELDFYLDGKQPEQLVFESSLHKDKFRVKKFGETYLGRMSDEFVYQVYEGENLQRSITVGHGNPGFVPLSAIPHHLQNAVLTTEDPSFFRHRGFINEAFRESIIENYKTKAFKRGGSTISMQLVKNVFLNRKKTVFRKIEEALLVWIIESQRLTSKERMFEVYFNIIEWGPGVYGIGEASRYYFNKRPSELNLGESIYLATIIPRPKKFKYCFDKEGCLRDFMITQSNFIMRRMVQREFLQPQDTLDFDPDINLRGPAREIVSPTDLQDYDKLFLEDDVM